MPKNTLTMHSSADVALEHSLMLRFFDVDVIIRSDAPRFIDLFRVMYGRFVIDTLAATPVAPLECTVLTGLHQHYTTPVLLLADQVYPLDARLLEGHVYERVVQEVVTRVRSHVLLHAGVVAYQGQAVVLAANAFHGKTTLVLELLRRGCSFLSDEMAALGRTDGYVYPFPRSLRVRPRTLELTGLTGLADPAATWLGKYILDIERLQPGCLAQPTPLTHVVILHSVRHISDVHPHTAEPTMAVRVDHVDTDMLTAIRCIAGVRDVQVDSAYGYPVLNIWSSHRTRTLAQIEIICRQYHVEVLTVFKHAEARPDFTTPARLQSIPRTQAVLELLQHFLGGHRSALLQQEYQGNSTYLFMHLAALLTQAQCYRLDVGSLSTMADLVCDLVGLG